MSTIDLWNLHADHRRALHIHSLRTLYATNFLRQDDRHHHSLPGRMPCTTAVPYHRCDCHILLYIFHSPHRICVLSNFEHQDDWFLHIAHTTLLF